MLFRSGGADRGWEDRGVIAAGHRYIPVSFTECYLASGQLLPIKIPAVLSRSYCLVYHNYFTLIAGITLPRGRAFFNGSDSWIINKDTVIPLNAFKHLIPPYH